MTPAEIIAVELFGWERMHCEWPDEIWYCHPSGSEYRIGCELPDDLCFESEEPWPDFTDPIRKWYWLWRMENALVTRCLLDLYISHLDQQFERCEPVPWPNRSWSAWAMLRATSEQKVAAALKALGKDGTAGKESH